MRLPPGEPRAARKLPSALNTIVGAIDERGRLPGATALAICVPSSVAGRNEKSVSWLFRRKPPVTPSSAVTSASELTARSMPAQI